jgi:hypothetical protein
MVSYYKFNNSYFKLDSEKTYFQQINNLPTEKLLLHSQGERIIEALHLAKVNDNWLEITEEEYNTVKSSVLDYLSAN